MKAMSWSSHLPWEPVKVISWEGHYLLQFILRHQVLQLTIFTLVYFYPLQMIFTSQTPFHLYHLHMNITEFYVISIFIQLYNRVAWSPSGLSLNFDTPIQFNTTLEGINVLGVPLGTSSFTSSFINDALRKDVRHANLFLKIDDVQVVYGILTHCFMQQPSYILCCTFSNFFFHFDRLFCFF